MALLPGPHLGSELFKGVVDHRVSLVEILSCLIIGQLGKDKRMGASSWPNVRNR
jgi:hypothetical protein